MSLIAQAGRADTTRCGVRWTAKFGGRVVAPGGDGAGCNQALPGLTGAAGGSEALRLGVYDEDGPGSNPGGLYVSGDFNFAGGVPIVDFARWGCPRPPGGRCYADCNGDGVRNLADFGCFQTKFALGCP